MKKFVSLYVSGHLLLETNKQIIRESHYQQPWLVSLELNDFQHWVEKKENKFYKNYYFNFHLIKKIKINETQ